MMLGPLLLWFALAQAPSGAVASKDAKNYVGHEATVCGKVASTRYLETGANRATFLNFDRPNPEQTFTVVIFGDHRDKFDRPEIRFKDKQICVTGRIVEYRGTPQIVASEPTQIKEATGLLPSRIHSSEAPLYVGSDVTVCGFVASTSYDTAAEGKPTSLYFDRPSPDQTLVAVIPEDARKKFGEPEGRYLHRTVCVTGKLEKFQTSVRIILSDPKQLSLLQ